MRGGHTSVGLCNTTILWAALASHCLPGEIQGVIIYKALHGTGLFVGPPVPKGISLSYMLEWPCSRSLPETIPSDGTQER